MKHSGLLIRNLQIFSARKIRFFLGSLSSLRSHARVLPDGFLLSSPNSFLNLSQKSRCLSFFFLTGFSHSHKLKFIHSECRRLYFSQG
jgi:hypothetical protein